MKKMPLSFYNYVASNIVFFVGIVMGVIYSPKFTGVAIIIWVVSLIWVITDVMKVNNVKVTHFTDEVLKKSKESYSEKKNVKGAVYLLTIPIMGVGIAVLTVSVSVFFYM